MSHKIALVFSNNTASAKFFHHLQNFCTFPVSYRPATAEEQAEYDCEDYDLITDVITYDTEGEKVLDGYMNRYSAILNAWLFYSHGRCDGYREGYDAGYDET